MLGLKQVKQPLSQGQFSKSMIWNCYSLWRGANLADNRCECAMLAPPPSTTTGSKQRNPTPSRSVQSGISAFLLQFCFFVLALSVLPQIPKDGVRRFYLMNVSGVLQPRESKTVYFMFKSPDHGVSFLLTGVYIFLLFSHTFVECRSSRNLTFSTPSLLLFSIRNTQAQSPDSQRYHLQLQMQLHRHFLQLS